MQMKNALQCGMVLLLIIGFASGCKAQSRPNNNPALQKATDWIKTQLPRAGARDSTNLQSWSENFSNVAVTGCTLTFTYRYTEDHSRYDGPEGERHEKDTTTYTVALGQLSSATWEPPSEVGGEGDILLKASGNAITSKWKKTVARPYGAPETTDGSNSLPELKLGVIDDSHLSLTPAFSRAIQLCGGKGGDSSSQLTSGASMDETLQSITMGLQKAGVKASDPETKQHWNIDYSDVAGKSCSVTFSINIDGEQAGMGRARTQQKFSVTLPLGQLSGASTMPYTDESIMRPVKETMVVLSASGKVIPESWKKIVTPDGGNAQIASGTDNFNSLRIYTTDSALAGKLADAFSRGIQLCGGKTAF